MYQHSDSWQLSWCLACSKPEEFLSVDIFPQKKERKKKNKKNKSLNEKTSLHVCSVLWLYFCRTRPRCGREGGFRVAPIMACARPHFPLSAARPKDAQMHVAHAAPTFAATSQKCLPRRAKSSMQNAQQLTTCRENDTIQQLIHRTRLGFHKKVAQPHVSETPLRSEDVNLTKKKKRKKVQHKQSTFWWTLSYGTHHKLKITQTTKLLKRTPERYQSNTCKTDARIGQN